VSYIKTPNQPALRSNYREKHGVNIRNKAISILGLLGFGGCWLPAADLLCYESKPCVVPKVCYNNELQRLFCTIPRAGVLVPDPNPTNGQNTATYAIWNCSLPPYANNPSGHRAVAWKASGYSVNHSNGGVPDGTIKAGNRFHISTKSCVVFLCNKFVGGYWEMVEVGYLDDNNWRIRGDKCTSGGL
jgi:hypothetical protein